MTEIAVPYDDVRIKFIVTLTVRADNFYLIMSVVHHGKRSVITVSAHRFKTEDLAILRFGNGLLICGLIGERTGCRSIKVLSIRFKTENLSGKEVLLVRIQPKFRMARGGKNRLPRLLISI